MFSKDIKGSSATSPTNGSAHHNAKASGVPSIISPDLKIVGDLKSGGDIQIDGSVEGDINSRLLTIGEGAVVKGSIVADTARISGTVIGRVNAKSVTLDKTAKVTGDIAHENLTMEAGAFLEGHVQRLGAVGASSDAKVAQLRPSTSGNAQETSFTETRGSETRGSVV